LSVEIDVCFVPIADIGAPISAAIRKATGA
jgi:hypothetical protein